MAVKEVDNFRANVRTLTAEYGAVKKLADKAGLARPYLSDILRGHASPGLDVAIRISAALGYTLDELLVSPGNFFPNKCRSLLTNGNK